MDSTCHCEPCSLPSSSLACPPCPEITSPCPPPVPHQAGGGIRGAGIGGGAWFSCHQPDLQVGRSAVCTLLSVRFDINTDLTVQAWEEMAAVSTASWISSSVSSASSATETPPRLRRRSSQGGGSEFRILQYIKPSPQKKLRRVMKALPNSSHRSLPVVLPAQSPGFLFFLVP